MAGSGTILDLDFAAAPRTGLARKTLPTTFGGSAKAGYPLGLRSDGYRDPSFDSPLSLIGGSMAAGTHLLGLPNAAFEDGLTGWTTATGTTGGGSSTASVVIDATASVTGVNAVLMTNAASTDTCALSTGIFPAGESIPLLIAPRCRVDSGSPTMALTVTFYDKTKTALASGGALSNPQTVVPSAVFRELGAVVTPPVGARYASVSIGLTGAGALRVDELRTMRRIVGAVNVRDFGALGDTRQVTVTSVTSGSKVVSAAAGTFRASDLGKYVVVRGAGAKASGDFNGASLVSTVTAVAADGSSITIKDSPSSSCSSLTTTSTSATGVVSASSTTALTAILGSDDTAAVAGAIAAAMALGAAVYFPQGGYCLGSQATSIPLSNVTFIGEGGAQSSGADYTHTGSTIIVTNPTVSPFTLSTGVNMRGMSCYYPAQDGATMSPVVYPAFMTGTAITRCNFTDCTFVNPYILMDLPSASGNLGDVRFTACRAFAVTTYFHFIAPAFDVLDCTSCFFSLGVYEDCALDNFQYLANAHAKTGIFLDCECGSSAHGSLDGFSFTSNIFFGMRYVFYFGSGGPNLWNMTNNRYDYVGSVLFAIGTAFSTGAIMAFNGGYVTSAQLNGQNDANCFQLGSTGGQLILVINGMNLSLCNGSWIIESTNCCKRLTVSGNDFGPFGISGKVSSYYGVGRTNNQNAFTNVTGNTFTSQQAGGQVNTPIYLQGQATVVGSNIITGAMAYGIRLTGNGGAFTVTGNTVQGDTGANAFYDQTTSAVVVSTGNFFDKASNVTHSAGA